MASIEEYLETLPQDDYLLTHKRRYIATHRRLQDWITPTSVVVELGGISPVSTYLNLSLAQPVGTVEKDLRRPFDYPSASADVVLCLEVLEHLHDVIDPGCTFEALLSFNKSGAQNLLRECHRILKPGGILFLTTPNASSVDTLINVATKQPPFLYAPHVREYCLEELLALGSAAGLQFVEADTFSVWGIHPDAIKEAFLRLLDTLGYETAFRGDDMVAIFRKAQPAA